MKHHRSRKPAEAVGNWKFCIGTLLPSVLAYCLVFCPTEVGWAGLACLSNPCLYGICIDDVNSTFLCYCMDGYTGFLCQTNWDECWSNPCLNGGVCIDGIAQYNCSCPQGYQGELCEQNIDECDSNPCHNNGTCIDGPNGYTCLCPAGYVGDFCETDVSVCNDTQETRCLNGGLCIEGPGCTFNCACPLGWEGQYCEEAMDECASSPCLNGAVCLDLHANYTCACPFGFTGRNCEIELEMCGDKSPCQNGAVCLVEDWLRVCYCVPDFHGDRCQFQYNECLLGPGCKNGGTCIDGVDGYTCSCPLNWTGKFCECLILSEEEIDCNYVLRSPVPTWNETAVPKTTLHKDHSSTISPTKQTTPKHSHTTECVPFWSQFTVKTPKTTTQAIIPVKNVTFPENWLTQVTLPTQKAEPMTTAVTTEVTKATQPTTPETTYVTTTTTQTIPITMTQAASTTTQTTPTTTVTTTTQTTPTTTTTTQTTPTTTSTTETTQITTTTTQTIPTTTTTEITSTTTTTKTTPTTTTTEETTPTTTTTTTSTTTQTPPTTTTMTTTTQTTPTTTTTTQTTPTTTTTTQTTPTTTSTTETTTVTTQTTPTITTTTTTQTTPLTTTTIQTTTTTTETTPPPTTTTTITTTTTSTESSAVVPSSSPTEPTTGSPVPWDCKITPCKNGGMCLNTTTGPRCLCRVNWEGPFCDNKTDIKVVGLSGKSYLSHRLTNTHSIRIDVTARTIARAGVILYSHLGPNIFMTLYLENGLLKFKFSCGVQTMLLSEVQFHINNGFDLVATVTLDFLPRTNSPLHCAAAVRINNTLAMSGEQLAKGPHADSGYAWVYIGGVPSRYVDIEEVPVLEGFVGCMQNLVINKEERGILKDSFDGDEITECKSLACLSNPCRSGATCVESNNTWSCLCPSGFLGQTCETSVCNTNPCLYGGTCAPFPGSGFICLCPLGKQGLFCENDVETGYPLFSSSVGGLSSFAAYKLPVEIYQDMLLTFKFLPHDMEQISLMIFIGQDGYHSATSDHLAVSFIKGYVVLTWNLGSGPRRIFTTHPVPNTGRFFHTVQIGRTGQRAWLAVDNQRNVTGRSPGKLTQLNTRSLVYLGGHDSRNFSLLPHDLPLHTGFSGCLFDVELRTGQMLIKIEKTSPAFSRGVGQCGRTLCNKNSCKNGGGCIHHGATFTCLCSDGWFGPTCSMKFNPCDSSRHNCSTGSTCVPLRHGFVCDCPVGKTGKYCETSEELSDVKLTGTRSYLALAVDGLNPHQTCLDLELRPQTYHGLVFYSGKAEGNSFWSLLLQDGVLELRISPGVHRRRGNILVIKSRRQLTLGKWHRIRIGRYGRRLFLWVEGTASTGVLLPGENLPPSGTVLFIGGVPDLSKLPIGVSGKFLTPFQGCIRKLASRWKTVPLTKSNIIEGRNVEDCDGTLCGGDVCENGGTCQLDLNKRPFCTCLKEYLGKRCEYRLSCKEVSCHNGGRCADQKSLIPQCHCPNGWGGPFCETAVTVKSPQFGGNSYLLIDRTESTTMKRRHTSNKVDVDFVYLNFTTAEDNGMLLWSSREAFHFHTIPSSSRERDAEFLGIGVENGKMKFVWAWEGNDPFIITSNENIADGAWHDVAISFDSPNITIWMDRQMIYKSNMSYPGYPLVTDGKFFLGGFPEHTKIANETLGHFLTGFDGCLQKLSWGTESEIFNFANFTGENIRTCDSLGLRKRK